MVASSAVSGDEEGGEEADSHHVNLPTVNEAAPQNDGPEHTPAAGVGRRATIGTARAAPQPGSGRSGLRSRLSLQGQTSDVPQQVRS